MEKKNSLLRNTTLLMLGNLITKGLQFVMLPFLTRWLSTEEYGIFDLLSTYIALLLPVLSLSMSEAVFRFSVDHEESEKKRKYITMGFWVTTINLSIFIIVFCLILKSYSLTYKIAFILMLVGQLYNSHLQGVLRAIKKISIYSFGNAISIALTSIVVLYMVKVLKYGILGMIYGYAIGYIIGDILIALTIKYWKYFSVRELNFILMKRMIKYSLPLIPNDISWWILNVSDRQIINFFLGASSNGIYAISNKIPALCTSVFGMFGISWQQEVTEVIGSDSRGEYFNSVYNQILVIIIPLCSIILSLNFLFFDFIFDSKYSDGEFYVPILLTAVIFAVLMQFYGGIQIGLRNPAETGITTIIGAIINLSLNIVLIKSLGLYASAISTLVANCTAALLRKYRLKSVVVFKHTRQIWMCVAVYMYFNICIYTLNSHYILKTFNILFAFLFFGMMNRKIIKQILHNILLI